MTGEDTRTEPDPQWVWIWRAWHRLSSERTERVEGVMMPMGGGVIHSCPGHIPWTAVRAWADHHDLSAAEFILLDRCLMAMDTTFATHWRKRKGAK